MKKLIVHVSALAVLSCFAAEKKESPFKALDKARAVFNMREGGVFRGAKAHEYRLLPAADRFDQAAGAAKWVLALPLKNDARIRYVTAEFKDGAFVCGEVRKLGLKPEKLDDKSFAVLRQEFPMLAIRADATGKDCVCAFYPAGKVSDTQRNNLIRYGVGMNVDPNKRYLAGLCSIDRYLGVNMNGVRYEYSITTPEGDVLEMGMAGNGRKMLPLMREQLEALHPEKKGLYSDRDLVDMYCAGLITYRPER